MNKVFVISLLILFFGIIGVFAVAFFQSSFTKVDIYKEERLEGDQIEDIEINTSSTDVEVVPSETSEIVVLLDGKINKDLEDKYKLSVDHSHNKLSINYVLDENIVGVKLGSAQDTQIQVKVPDKAFNYFQAKTSSGEILINNLEVNEINVESTSGDQSIINTEAQGHITSRSTSGNISTRKSKVNSANYFATSGNIDVNNLSSEDSVFKTSSGNITFNGEQLKSNMEYETSSGDVAIKFSQTPKSVWLDFKTSSGKPEISIEDLSFEDKSKNSTIGVKGNGDYEIKVRTTSGDLTLE